MVAGGGWDIEKDEKGGRTMGGGWGLGADEKHVAGDGLFCRGVYGVAMLFCAVCTLC